MFCRQWGCGWKKKKALRLVSQHSEDVWGLKAGFAAGRFCFVFFQAAHGLCLLSHRCRAAPSALLPSCAVGVVSYEQQRQKRNRTKQNQKNSYLFFKFRKKGYIHIDNNVKFIMYKSSISLQSGKKKNNNCICPPYFGRKKNNKKKSTSLQRNTFFFSLKQNKRVQCFVLTLRCVTSMLYQTAFF